MPTARRVAWRITRRVAVTVGILAVSVACSDTMGPNDHVGTYDLFTVNGNPIPAVLSTNNGVTTSAIGGRFTLRSNGTFTQRLETQQVQTGGGSTVTTVAEKEGNYRRDDTKLTLDYTAGGTSEFSLVGGTLTATFNSRSYAFSKN
jgi:hypothetical protein